MVNRRERRTRRVEIEIPLSSVRQYVGGSGPPMQKLYATPPRDSTAYIIDRIILPAPQDTTPLDRRIPHYLVSWSDLPLATVPIPCHRALEYVSPAEIEQWEANDYERRLEKKAQEALSSKKTPGNQDRPRKKPLEEDEDDLESAVPVAGDALLLASHVTGPSLSTPRKIRHAKPKSVGASDEDSDDEPIHNTGNLDESDSVDLVQSRPSLGLRQEAFVEDSSRASSARGSTTPTMPDFPRPKGKKPNLLSSAPAPARMSPASLQKPLSSTPKAVPAPISKSKIQIPQSAQSQIVSPITDFTPVASSSVLRARPSSAGANGTGIHSDTSSKRKRESPRAQPKDKKARTYGKDKDKTSGKDEKKGKGKAKGKKLANPEGPNNNIEPDVWVVKELLDDKWIKDKGSKVHMYLVNWKGEWPPDQNPTWEPASNIQDETLIAEYRRRKKAGLLKPDNSQKLILEYMIGPQYSNVAEAFEGDLNEAGQPAANALGTGSPEASDNELSVMDLASSHGKPISPRFPQFDQQMTQARNLPSGPE